MLEEMSTGRPHRVGNNMRRFLGDDGFIVS